MRRLVVTHISPQATSATLARFLGWVREYPIPIVFVDLTSTEKALRGLEGRPTEIGVPCGHPTGLLSSDVKVAFVKGAIQANVAEIDMGLNLDYIRQSRFDLVTHEVQELMDVAGGAIRLVFTVDLPLFSVSESLQICEAILRGGGAAICTAWGYGMRTDAELVQLLAQRFASDLLVEASGGIRTHAAASQMITYGAHRIHSGDPKAIIRGASNV